MAVTYRHAEGCVRTAAGSWCPVCGNMRRDWSTATDTEIVRATNVPVRDKTLIDEAKRRNLA